MRVILSAWGTAFLHVSADDVSPLSGVPQQDLVQTVAAMYEFAAQPQFNLLGIPQPHSALVFQSGRFMSPSAIYPVQQLVIYGNGDAVTGPTTEAADQIMDDFIHKLNEQLGYRFGESRQYSRTYASALIVEFDRALEEYVPMLAKVGQILDKAIPRLGRQFKPKMFTFGDGDPITPAALNSIDAADKLDFAVQRRAGESYSLNRYFSSAPLQTNAHIKVLQDIESALNG